MRIDDPSVEPHHVLLTVAPDGAVAVVQLTGRVPCRVDGEPIAGTTSVVDGSTIELGSSRLRLTRPEEPHGTGGDGRGGGEPVVPNAPPHAAGAAALGPGTDPGAQRRRILGPRRRRGAAGRGVHGGGVRRRRRRVGLADVPRPRARRRARLGRHVARRADRCGARRPAQPRRTSAGRGRLRHRRRRSARRLVAPPCGDHAGRRRRRDRGDDPERRRVVAAQRARRRVAWSRSDGDRGRGRCRSRATPGRRSSRRSSPPPSGSTTCPSPPISARAPHSPSAARRRTPSCAP